MLTTGFVILILLEGFCRFDGKYYKYIEASEKRRVRPIPDNYTDFESNRPKLTNNIYRIMAIGDSFTHGSTLGESKAWPSILQNNLRKENSNSTTTYEVFNGGCPGAGVAEEVDNIKKAVNNYQPDLIIHQLFSNDFYQVPQVNYPECGDFERKLHFFRAPDFRSHLLYYLWRIKKRIYYSKKFTAYIDCYVKPERPHWEILKKMIFDTEQLTKEKGIEYCVLLFPSLHWKNGNYPLNELHNTIRTVMGEDLGCYFDLLPDLMDEYEVANEYWLDIHLPDAHPNQVMHNFIGDRIYEYLPKKIKER